MKSFNEDQEALRYAAQTPNHRGRSGRRVATADTAASLAGAALLGVVHHDSGDTHPSASSALFSATKPSTVSGNAQKLEITLGDPVVVDGQTIYSSINGALNKIARTMYGHDIASQAQDDINSVASIEVKDYTGSNNEMPGATYTVCLEKGALTPEQVIDVNRGSPEETVAIAPTEKA